MRKFITSIAVIAMAAAMMTGCGKTDKKTTTAASTKAEVQTEAIIICFRTAYERRFFFSTRAK